MASLTTMALTVGKVLARSLPRQTREHEGSHTRWPDRQGCTNARRQVFRNNLRPSTICLGLQQESLSHKVSMSPLGERNITAFSATPKTRLAQGISSTSPTGTRRQTHGHACGRHPGVWPGAKGPRGRRAAEIVRANLGVDSNGSRS